MMRRYIALLFVVAFVLGCGKKHPVKVFVDPALKSGSVEKIAVFPFASSLHHADDPDNVAPRTMDLLFREQLDTRHDYKFVAPSSVTYALEGEGLGDEAEAFVNDWRQFQKVNVEFLSKIAQSMQIDAVLLGVVDLWQKDEVDVQENAAPATYVGATITIIDVNSGGVLFQASDENFIEGARSEERTVIRSGLGGVYSDPGANVFKAPEHKEVAIRVARALVGSIPAR